MTRRWNYSIQLHDRATGAPIVTAGGVCYVAKNGVAGQETLFSDQDGTSATNPVALTRGKIDFWTIPSNNDLVDLYIQCPGGQFVVARNVSPSGPNVIEVDTDRIDQCMVIPFEQDDFTANTETDTGFDEPTNAVFKGDASGVGVRVVDVDATETISVGTDSGDSGDADGLIVTADIATAGVVLNDQGALLTTLLGHISGGKSITITTSAGADTGSGFIYLPYILLN